MAENKVFEGVLAELGERTKRPLEVRGGPLRIRFLIRVRDGIVNRLARTQASHSWGSVRVKTQRKGEVNDNTERVSETKAMAEKNRDKILPIKGFSKCCTMMWQQCWGHDASIALNLYKAVCLTLSIPSILSHQDSVVALTLLP